MMWHIIYQDKVASFVRLNHEKKTIKNKRFERCINAFNIFVIHNID